MNFPYDPDRFSDKPESLQSRQPGRWLRALVFIGKHGATWLPLIQVAMCLAAQPGADERAMLMFLLPPVAASLVLLADNGQFNRTVVRGACLLLSVNAVTSLIAAIDILPLKPVFPGKLPARVDRTLVLYLAGWYSFVLIICPVWYLRWRIAGAGRNSGRVEWMFAVGWLGWAAFVVAFAVLGARKIL